MSLDLTPLENAIQKLEKSIEFSKSDIATNDEEIFEQFRNSVIQCYEFTYELCWKMLKRQIELDAANASLVDKMNFKELMRDGAERGFIRDPVVWFQYRQDRNLASHTYDLEVAQAVYLRALSFLADAQHLCIKLKERNLLS